MNGNWKKRSVMTGRLLVLFIAFIALTAATGWGADHRTVQDRPISLGTSGGNIYDSTSRYCCSGTLGALVQDGNGVQYILSNNHVLARSNQAAPGEPVSQPGLIDQGCRQDGIVAHLSAFKTIGFRTKKVGGPTNEVDAAIARTENGAVRQDGDILGIGTVSGNTVLPSVGQQVQKSGRTTGHTFGEVAAVNVTVDVGYSSECGGSASQVGRFVNQVRITPGGFSAGGDSGSVIFESGSTDPANGRPRAVGLLFAGSSTSTLANPINAALAAFGVTMVGGAPPAYGSLSGIVKDAQTAAGIAGAAVSADTGQSTTTNGSGAYLLTNVPTGNRTVTASATGYASQTVPALVSENSDTTVNFALEKLSTATQSIVQCVTYDVARNKKHMYVTISVVDDFGAPVTNAQVSISLTRNGSLYRTGTGTTGSSGAFAFTVNNASDGLYVATVTNVVATGLSFEGTTPANAFTKGADLVPAVFCRSGAVAAASGDAASARLKHAKAVLAGHSNALFSLPSAVGHGIGLSSGSPVIEIYLTNENASARAMAPTVLDGVPVRIIVTGPFKAY